MSLQYTSLRILELDGGSESFQTGDHELIVLPLAGSCTVTIEGERFELAGRESVFSALTDFAYGGRAHRAVVTATPDVGWYTEETFVRLAVHELDGTYRGRTP